MVKQCFQSMLLTAARVGGLVLLVCAPIWAGERNTAPATDAKEVNNGEDPTRPLTRFDFRYEFEALSGDHDKHTFILRTDKRFVLGNGWQLASRLDMPFVYTDASSADNPSAAWTRGTGDLLLQGLLIKAFDHVRPAACRSPWHAIRISYSEPGSVRDRPLPAGADRGLSLLPARLQPGELRGRAHPLCF
jgi:hypothetical protein